MAELPSLAYPVILAHAKRILLSGTALEIRLLRNGPALAGYFSDPVRMADDIVNHDRANVLGAYFMASPVPIEFLARIDNHLRVVTKEEKLSATDADVLFRTNITFDLDPIRASGISSTDMEHERALLRAHDIAITMNEWYGWPDPDIIDSGNGAHLRWWLNRMENTPENTALIQACLHKAANTFNDQHVEVDVTGFNASRIWRFPGTIARKGEHMPDRPWRTSGYVSKSGPLDVLSPAQLVLFAGRPASALLTPSQPKKEGIQLPPDNRYRSLNRKALDRLDDWVPVLFPAAYRSTQGWRLTSKAIGRDRMEDLSFTPKGIKDFGEHDMDDPLEGKRSPVMVVAEFVTGGDGTAAAALLAETLQVTTSGFTPLAPPSSQPPAMAALVDPNEGLGVAPVGTKLTDDQALYMFSDDMKEAYDDLPFMHTGISQYGLANWRIASPKTGKTVLVYEEALRGLMGLPIFGQLLKCEKQADWAIIYAFEDNPKPAKTLLYRQYKEICKDTGTEPSDEVFNAILARIAIVCPYSREFRDKVLRGDIMDMYGGDYLDSIEPLCKTAKAVYGPDGIVVVDTFEEMTGYMNGMSKNPVEMDMAKVHVLNDKALHLGVCMLVTHHLTKSVNRNLGGDMASYIAGTYGIESKLNNYLMLKGPTDDDYKKGIKDLGLIHKSRLRDLDGIWFHKIPKMLRPQGHIFIPVATERKIGQLSDDADAVRGMMVDQLQKYFKISDFMALCSMSRPRVQRALAELELAQKIVRLAKTPQYDVFCIKNTPGHRSILLELKLKDGSSPDIGLPDVL